MITLKTNIGSVLSPLILKVQDFKAGNPAYDNVLREVALQALADVRTRIHQEGKASDGNDIGEYSKEPIYVSVEQNKNIGKSFGRPIGKTGRSKFKGGEKKGQDHKSRYFAGGYNEYKTTIGRNVLGKVNLSLTGQLDNQLTVIATQNGYGLGWANDEMLERAKHLEKKYGKKIWSLTEEEKKNAANVAKTHTDNAFS